jgi:hypothetical protein
MSKWYEKYSKKELAEQIDWFDKRDSEIMCMITSGMSKSRYDIESIKKEYELANIRVDWELNMWFDDIKNCELQGKDLIDYLKMIFNKLYKKLEATYNYENLFTWEELLEKIKESKK